MALIGKAYNPFGMGSGGSGLASGFKYAQGLKDRQTFAEGFNEYVNATDDAQKNSALAKMASVDGQNAVRLMDNSLQRELANRQLAQKQAEFDWTKEKFDQMTPYQRESLDLQRNQLDWQRENAENARKMNEYQTWQKDEALRKEQEAKEKEKALGEAISEYYIAKDDDGRNAALSKAAMIDPKATSDFYKKIKTQEALDKGWTTDTGRLWEIYNDQNQPEENRMLAGMILKSKASDPTLKGTVAYQTEIGKQAAQAGVPYSNGQVEQIPVQKPMPSTFGGYMDTQPQQQMQAMQMQAHSIPTAAQLAADKMREEKNAEYLSKQDVDSLKGWVDVNGERKVLKGSEAEREWLKENEKQLTNNDIIMRGAITVPQDIKRAMAIINESPNKSIGLLGSIYRNIPETDAYNLNQLIKSIQAQIGIDTLLDIKKSGAGLGQVPQAQLEMLAGIMGNLNTAQSKEQLVKTLDRVDSLYSDIIKKAKESNEMIYSRIYDPNASAQPQEEIIYYEDL